MFALQCACAIKNSAQKIPSDVEVIAPDGFRLAIPNRFDVRYFFQSNEELWRHNALHDLRSVRLPSTQDLEIRCWMDARPSFIFGVILRRINTQWSATHIEGIYRDPRFEYVRKELPPPKSSWDELWKKLDQNQILSLPQAADIGCNVESIDGMYSLVEINHHHRYRIYTYGNPQRGSCEEAKKVMRILSEFSGEFDLPRMGS